MLQQLWIDARPVGNPMTQEEAAKWQGILKAAFPGSSIFPAPVKDETGPALAVPFSPTFAIIRKFGEPSTSEMTVYYPHDLPRAAATMYYQKDSAPIITLRIEETGEVLWHIEHNQELHRSSLIDEALPYLK